MEYIALGLAVLAVVFALAANAKAAAALRELEGARQEGRRNAANVQEALENELAVTRRLLAAVADGSKPTREMILEGQLWRDVDGTEAASLVQSGKLRVIDVRTPAETAGGVIPGAVLIPIDTLESRAKELALDRRPTLIYCAAGGRSAAACDFLSGEGFSDLYNLAGGIGVWKGPLQRA